MKEDGKYFNAQEFNQIYDIKLFEYLGWINVIRAYLREHNLYIEDGHSKNILKYMVLVWIHLWGVQHFLMIFCLEELKFLTHAKIGGTAGKGLWSFCRYEK